MHGTRHEEQGFTLVELLVVMSIIAIFLGVLGLALSGDNKTMATQTGQRTIAGLVTAARAQAILKQAPVRLIVHNDWPEATDDAEVQQEKRDRYLRFIGMVYLDDQTGLWEPLNEGVYLPRGVYVVPPRQYNRDGALTNPPPEVISDNDNDWPRARRSVVVQATDDYDYDSALMDPNDRLQNYFHIEFDRRGMIVGAFSAFTQNGADGRLVIAPARQTPLTPEFEDGSDNSVLGGVLRRYGSLTMIHDPIAFPEIVP